MLVFQGTFCGLPRQSFGMLEGYMGYGTKEQNNGFIFRWGDRGVAKNTIMVSHLGGIW